MPHSFRSRLTLWYAASLSIIVLLFAFAIYGSVRHNLLMHVQHQLSHDIAQIEKTLQEYPEDISELDTRGTIDLFQIYSNGRTIYSSASWELADLDQLIGASSGNQAEYGRLQNNIGLHWQRENVSARGQSYAVTVAHQAAVIDSSLHTVWLTLAVGSPAAILFAVLGGYFMAGRFLAPITGITKKAEQISADNLAERLPVTYPDDELGRLATVFNGVLDRIEGAFIRLRRFTADASHELRTPLTAIRSVGEVALEGDDLPAPSREIIGSMLEEVSRLTHLIDRLLLLARADSGGMVLAKENIDLTSMVQDCVDCLRILAEEKHQHILSKSTNPVMAFADSSILRLAVMNILDNAIKYSPEHSTIDIRTGASADENWIEIIDQGRGIATTHHAGVFDRFSRIDEGRSNREGGTGLGLAIAQWAVEANDGHIKLQSNAGQGCLFRIVLPANQ